MNSCSGWRAASSSRRSGRVRLAGGVMSAPRGARALLGELGRAPAKGGDQALLLADLVELHPHLGARGVERGEHVETGADGVAEAGGVGAAADGELGGGKRLGRDESETPGEVHGCRLQLG